MHVLVTGGAGYIGSHVVVALLDAGHTVEVVDDLSAGHAAAVDPRAPLYRFDVRETPRLASRMLRADAVLHFVALSDVAESVRQPERYREDNLGSLRSVLRAMRIAGTHRLGFSSSAAVYGAPAAGGLIRESSPRKPVNPYGEAKLACEEVLASACRADPGLQVTALRYFNVAGAGAHGRLGEHHTPETHLIPLLVKAAQTPGSRFDVYGTDYPTRDGTCVRDFLHVDDLSRAHLLALRDRRAGFEAYNVGSGRGWSVLEVVEAVRRVTGVELRTRLAARRPGDPPWLVTDIEKISRMLDWRPLQSTLDEMVGSTWRWSQRFPRGYAHAEAGFGVEPVHG